MGKHGPCCHCGITSTPLWRNGPLEKPVLCNACGSRWRTKGTLSNYTPLHAREPIEWEEPKVTKMKSIYFKTTEQKLHKRRQINAIVENAREIPFSESGQNYIKTFEGDAGNRSSSESEISYSESCGNMGAISASDYAGSAQSNAWDSLVLAPSKNKTTIKLIPSPVEKLTMDLYSIWHEQQSSNLSGSLEEDLLFEGKVLMGSVEIGHGGILLRYPSSKAVEEESEASSVTADKNLVSESYSRSSSSFVDNERNRTSLPNPSLDKFKKSALRVTLDHATSERFSSENLNMLQNWDSPLRPTDLKDIKNKRPTRVKKGESMSNLFRHVDLTPIVTPYESQNLQLQEFKNYMKNPKRVCRPSSSKLCLRKPSILNSSDAGSTELRGAEDSLGNEGICVSPGSLFASSPDKSSVLQFIGKSSNEDLPLHVHCSASYSEVENLYWNQMMATNSSMSESCAASEEENL